MKSVSDRTAKRRLLQLAGLLENSVEDEHFDFSTFGEVKSGAIGVDALSEANLCGTTACALGWAPALPFANRLGFRLEVRPYGNTGDMYADFTKHGKVVDRARVCQELFGLSWKTLRYIFDQSVLHPGGHDADRLDVARAIRDFVNIRYGK